MTKARRKKNVIRWLRYLHRIKWRYGVAHSFNKGYYRAQIRFNADHEDFTAWDLYEYVIRGR